MATNFSQDFARFLRDSQKAQMDLMGVKRGAVFQSTQPYQFDLESAGLVLLCDYEWEYDDGQADVSITAVRLMGYDGSEYPLKPGAIRSTTWNEICELIADEINDANDAAAQSLRDGE